MSQQIVLNIGNKQDEKILTQDDFYETPSVSHVDNAELTFYTAQDREGNITGTAQVNPIDRKVIGALVGNWIAAGYAVSRKTYKEMNKILREQQKTKDAQAAAIVAEQNGPLISHNLGAQLPEAATDNGENKPAPSEQTQVAAPAPVVPVTEPEKAPEPF